MWYHCCVPVQAEEVWEAMIASVSQSLAVAVRSRQEASSLAPEPDFPGLNPVSPLMKPDLEQVTQSLSVLVPCVLSGANNRAQDEIVGKTKLFP